jgi:hypothetical protein
LTHSHGSTARAPARRRVVPCLLAGLALAAAATPAQAQGLPTSSLAVWRDGAWRGWWRSGEAPVRWSAAHPEFARALRWREVHPGMEWAELEIAGSGTAWRLDVVVVRVDPGRVRLELEAAVRDGGTRGAWSIDSVPADALLALNAGQFTGGEPWGWLVRGGAETQPPGTGPLSMALVVDRSGGAHLLPADSIPGVRVGGAVTEAFQSYPMLLRDDGRVPAPLLASGRGVDVAHRDSRLAVGELRDGRLLFVLTRFGALGGAAGGLPFGPTTPEMAALMGALGCREAMLLDGGLSGQLLLRGGPGREKAWRGWRRVPLGLVARFDH